MIIRSRRYAIAMVGVSDDDFRLEARKIGRRLRIFLRRSRIRRQTRLSLRSGAEGFAVEMTVLDASPAEHRAIANFLTIAFSSEWRPEVAFKPCR